MPAVLPNDTADALNANIGLAACVTVMVLELAPVADTVIVAVRAVAFGFAVVAAIVKLLVVGVRVNQVAVPADAVHVVFDDTATLALLIPLSKLTAVAATDKVLVPASCVTVSVCAAMPAAVKVIVAVRTAVVALAVSVTVALPVVATAGLTVSHAADDVAVHVSDDVTPRLAVPPAAVILTVLLDSSNGETIVKFFQTAADLYKDAVPAGTINVP